MGRQPEPRPGVTVVVPTFREAENIAALAEGVAAVLDGRGLAWELLLSDDDSRDGSESVVAALAGRLPIRMEVRRGGPRDLSLAVLDGIRLARFERICVMDADLSHPPERIPDLLAILDRGRDLAVGSRYAPGGSIEGGWGLYRWLNSRGRPSSRAHWSAVPIRCRASSPPTAAGFRSRPASARSATRSALS